MPLMVFHRDYVLGSKFGHSVGFKKDTPTHVPPQVVPEAIAVGARMADGTSVDPPAEPAPHQAPSDPTIRAVKIEEAFKVILKKNDREDFMASGMPASPAVTRECGFSVPNKEIMQVWTAMKAREADPNLQAEASASNATEPEVPAAEVVPAKRGPGRPRKHDTA